MRTIAKIVALGVLASLASGCATTTHFTKLPSPEEFKKPLATLKQEYPDLTRFESTGSVFYMPEAEPLIHAWQGPHRTGVTAWMLIPFMWLTHPSNYWYWDFEGKEISALIDRPLAFGYKPHVSKLTVEEKDER